MTANHTAIHIENLTRDFGKVRALDGLSLDVPAGIIFGFLGPNGAGKTTTLNLLLGLLEPTAGHAVVLGFDTRTQADEVRARSGALLEHPGLYEQLSAEDNLEFYGRVYLSWPRNAIHAGISRGDAAQRGGRPYRMKMQEAQDHGRHPGCPGTPAFSVETVLTIRAICGMMSGLGLQSC